jgi:protein O-mannosyl-transferase
MLNKIKISPDRQKLIVFIVLTLATLTVFWQVNHYDFVNFDDNMYITKNSHILSGLTPEGVRWAFSTISIKQTGLWNPLVWLSFLFDYQLHGLNAGGYHLTNLILHVLSVLLLFWLFNRMTGAIWKSAFVAALFALHPLHVESVAWIAERKDVLSAFFWMLTLCLYVYYTEKPVIKRYLLVLFCFACALMSKPMVITLPVVMILLDYWPLGRLQSQKILTTTDIAPVAAKKGKQKNKSEKESLKKNISPPSVRTLSDSRIVGIIPLWQLREKIPFFILSAVMVIITLYAPNEPAVKHFPLSSRVANALVAFVTYLEKTFWPHDMTVFYPFPNQIPAGEVLFASLLILVISAAVIAVVKRLPYLFVGWLWYAITILPVIGIIHISTYAMADRYHYLPSIGIGIMMAWGIPLLFPREDMRKKILFPSGIAVLAMLSVLAWQQCGYWKNSIALFNHALQITKDNYVAHSSLGVVLFAEGKTEEAIDHYNKAIHITPDYFLPYSNRGIAYVKLGQYQRAIEDCSQAIRLKPDYVEAYNSRGTAYARLVQYQLAIEDYNEAIRLKPDYADAYNNRGTTYLLQGNNELGCPDAKKACALGNCKILEMAKSKGVCR